MATNFTDANRNRRVQVVELDGIVFVHAVTRTPSPTPSEAEALTKTGLKSVHWRSIFFRRPWYIYLILIFIIALAILIVIFRTAIEKWLAPRGEAIRNFPASWTFPILILFILTFPPLIGHELAIILIGFIWGLALGFGIVAAGTILGEVANFYVFRYWLQGRAEKLERSKVAYACLAMVIREGGLKVALLARYSFVPGHLLTIIFSVCGMNIFVFVLAVVLSLPKQLVILYIGSLFQHAKTKQAGKNHEGGAQQRKIMLPAMLIAFFFALLSMWYLIREMNRVKPDVIYKRRKARQVAALQSEYSTAIGLSTLRDSRSQELCILPDTDSTNKQDADSERTAKGIYRLSLPSLPGPHIGGTDDWGLLSV